MDSGGKRAGELVDERRGATPGFESRPISSIDERVTERLPDRRLIGIDIARGLALLGMAMVHVTIAGPDGEQPASWIKGILGAPSGSASVLFFVISGVSLSVIAKTGSASAEPDVLRRRGAVLLIFGFLLSATVWPASILEHYGVVFLIAPMLVRASSRLLSIMTAASLVGGPVVLLFARHLTSSVADYLSAGVLEWLLNWSWSLTVSGNFPLVVWLGFFALGLRIGRLDLGQPHTARRLLGFGLGVLAALWFALSFAASVGLDYEELAERTDALSEAGTGIPADTVPADTVPGSTVQVDPDRPDLEGGLTIRDEFIDDDPLQLLSAEAHSNQVAWAIYASALATTILGAALLLPAAVSRSLRPIAALGSISLTAYLLHLFLVLDGWHYFPATATVNQELAVLFVGEAILILACWGIVTRWRTGPAERLLKFLASR